MYSPYGSVDSLRSLVSSFLQTLRHTNLHTVCVRIMIDADKDTLLRQLRYLSLMWLDGFVEPLSRLEGGVGREAERRLKTVRVELRFAETCKFRKDEAGVVLEHVHRQLAGLRRRGVLDLDLDLGV